MTPAVSEESRIKSYNLGDIVELNNIIFIVNGTREVPENRFLSPKTATSGMQLMLVLRTRAMNL